MKILWISLQYPYGGKHTKGIFIKRSIDYLNDNLKGYELEALIPYTKTFPFISIFKYLKTYRKVIQDWKNSIPNKSDLGKASLHFLSYFRLPRPYFQHYEGFFFWLLNKKKITQKFRNYNIIHANWLTPEGHIAYLISQKTGIPYLVTFRGTDVYKCKNNKKLRRLSQKVIDNAALVTGNSNYILRVAQENGLQIKHKICKLTHSFYEKDKFRIIDKANARKELGLSESYKIVFFAGALRKIKNIDSLIKAFCQIHNLAYKLVIAGEGNEIGYLKKVVKECNLLENVTFIGTLKTNEMINYYNAADVFCLPSFQEGFGNVIIESLLCGTPVVASNVGEIPRHIKNDINGYLFDPYNIEEISTLISKAINKKWDRDILRKSVNFLFPANVKKEYEDIYNTLIGEHK